MVTMFLFNLVLPLLLITTVAAKPAATADRIGGLSLDEFKDSVVQKINAKRALHGVPPLERTAKLDDNAQKLADQLAASSNFEQTEPYGTSSYAFYWYNYREMTPNDAVDRWYGEGSSYDYSKPQFQYGTGSFTQMIWKGSQEIGIGLAQGTLNSWRVVAVYYPQGNVQGQFEQNVKQKTG